MDAAEAAGQSVDGHGVETTCYFGGISCLSFRAATHDIGNHSAAQRVATVAEIGSFDASWALGAMVYEIAQGMETQHSWMCVLPVTATVVALLVVGTTVCRLALADTGRSGKLS